MLIIKLEWLVILLEILFGVSSAVSKGLILSFTLQFNCYFIYNYNSIYNNS